MTDSDPQAGAGGADSTTVAVAKPAPVIDPSTVVAVHDVHKHYTLPRETLWRDPTLVHAVNGVTFTIEKGGSFGVVGESGCGKSTLARCVMGLETLTQGSVEFRGQNIHALPVEELRQLRRHFQMVFQDPFGSLDPRMKVARIVAEPIEALEDTKLDERRARVIEVLRAVGLKESDTDKYPHEFSGGQRQRIAIARALITRPALIVADEPVSALDVSVQAQVLNLLQDLQDEFGVTYLLISHDLAVVKFVCDEVAVMNEGVFVERGPTEEIFANPQHDYTKTLLAAVPQIGG
ncbi:MAG: ATP-binding cassette domain-containing protein [Proteobacteria bacterium]|nr:ATP-binding cassette domain-containing protein [Pseudomonadota bacterium]MDA1059442.1 ATP-binding cassette domain-containing protein [Pseudomonadota bacterium]